MANNCSAMKFVSPQCELIEQMVLQLENNPNWDALQDEYPGRQINEWHVDQYEGANVQDIVTKIEHIQNPGCLVWYVES